MCYSSNSAAAGSLTALSHVSLQYELHAQAAQRSRHFRLSASFSLMCTWRRVQPQRSSAAFPQRTVSSGLVYLYTLHLHTVYRTEQNRTELSALTDAIAVSCNSRLSIRHVDTRPPFAPNALTHPATSSALALRELHNARKLACGKRCVVQSTAPVVKQVLTSATLL